MMMLLLTIEEALKENVAPGPVIEENRSPSLCRSLRKATEVVQEGPVGTETQQRLQSFGKQNLAAQKEIGEIRDSNTVQVIWTSSFQYWRTFYRPEIHRPNVSDSF